MIPLSPRGRFAPLTDETVGSYTNQTCPLCSLPFEVGQAPALVQIGEPVYTSPDDEAKAALGRAHNVEVDMVHEVCAYPPHVMVAHSDSLDRIYIICGCGWQSEPVTFPTVNELSIIVDQHLANP